MAKRTISDLAVFGGEPAFERVLHVGRPNIGDREQLLERFEEMLERRWLTNHGPYVAEFEERVAALLGVEHCIAMCNATIALEIVVRAAGLEGEVIVPSFTFVATAHALQWQGITPVFCDVAPGSHNIDPHQIERLITPRTSGIIGVHLWGIPCDVEALRSVAERYDLTLLFDAAHAFGCSHRGEMVGNLGTAEVFSFHATKFLNTFEGGAVTTNDDELARKIRLMQNFGFAGMDNVIYIGTNGKMSEPSAAMGLTGLESLDAFIDTNHANYRRYREALRGVPGVTVLPYDEEERRNYQYIVLEIDERLAGIGRDRLLEILHAENVRARRYFYPGSHRMEPYRSYFPHAGLLLPETERLVTRVLTLPTGTAVGGDEIDQVCEIIRLVVQNSSEVSATFYRRDL